jgi:hypothetical protein
MQVGRRSAGTSRGDCGIQGATGVDNEDVPRFEQPHEISKAVMAHSIRGWPGDHEPDLVTGEPPGFRRLARFEGWRNSDLLTDIS